MKILLTGRNGQVGFDLARVLPALGELIATDRSSTDTCTSPTLQRANTLSVASAYDTLPPSAFVVSFARCAIAPLMPTLATFANHRVSSAPAHEW